MWKMNETKQRKRGEEKLCYCNITLHNYLMVSIHSLTYILLLNRQWWWINKNYVGFFFVLLLLACCWKCDSSFYGSVSSSCSLVLLLLVFSLGGKLLTIFISLFFFCSTASEWIGLRVWKVDWDSRNCWWIMISKSQEEVDGPPANRWFLLGLKWISFCVTFLTLI